MNFGTNSDIQFWPELCASKWRCAKILVVLYNTQIQLSQHLWEFLHFRMVTSLHDKLETKQAMVKSFAVPLICAGCNGVCGVAKYIRAPLQGQRRTASWAFKLRVRSWVSGAGEVQRLLGGGQGSAVQGLGWEVQDWGAVSQGGLRTDRQIHTHTWAVPISEVRRVLGSGRFGGRWTNAHTCLVLLIPTLTHSCMSKLQFLPCTEVWWTQWYCLRQLRSNKLFDQWNAFFGKKHKGAYQCQSCTPQQNNHCVALCYDPASTWELEIRWRKVTKTNKQTTTTRKVQRGHSVREIETMQLVLTTGAVRWQCFQQKEKKKAQPYSSHWYHALATGT